MSKDCVIIGCPPLSDYLKPPEDHSHSELFDCKMCKNKMWLSEKKKGILMFASCLNNEIILGCHNCIKKFILENPKSFKDAEIQITKI